MNNRKNNIKRRRKSKNKSLEMLEDNELLRKKGMIEKNLKNNFIDLHYFIKNLEGSIFDSKNRRRYGRLDGDYGRSRNNAELINLELYSRKFDLIDIFMPEHVKLVEETERKNNYHIREGCAKVNEGKTTEELKEREGVSREPLEIKMVSYRSGNPPRRYGYNYDN